MPAVTVIIPTYNRTEGLRRAVLSVLGQTCRDFELIVVDDGSEEPAELVVGDLVSNNHGSSGAGELRIVRIPHSGVSVARNTGITLSESPWIALLDSDDYWLPETLERQLAYLKASSLDDMEQVSSANIRPAPYRLTHYRLTQCREIWIRHGKRVSPAKKHRQEAGDLFSRSLDMCCISSSSVIMERALFDEFGCYDPALPACEDYDLWLRITSRLPVGLVDAQLVVKYGGHQDQLSKKYQAMDRFRIYALLKLLRGSDIAMTQISVEQVRAVCQTIARKATILAEGSAKRGREVRAREYRDLVNDMAGLMDRGHVALPCEQLATKWITLFLQRIMVEDL